MEESFTRQQWIDLHDEYVRQYTAIEDDPEYEQELLQLIATIEVLLIATEPK